MIAGCRGDCAPWVCLACSARGNDALRARLAEAEAKLATCATALEQTVRERDEAREHATQKGVLALRLERDRNRAFDALTTLEGHVEFFVSFASQLRAEVKSFQEDGSLRGLWGLLGASEANATTVARLAKDAVDLGTRRDHHDLLKRLRDIEAERDAALADAARERERAERAGADLAIVSEQLLSVNDALRLAFGRVCDAAGLEYANDDLPLEVLGEHVARLRAIETAAQAAADDLAINVDGAARAAGEVLRAAIAKGAKAAR